MSQVETLEERKEGSHGRRTESRMTGRGSSQMIKGRAGRSHGLGAMGRWVGLSQVRWEPLGCRDLTGGRETQEKAALLSKKEQLPMEVVGWGWIGVYFGGRTRDLLRNHVWGRRQKQRQGQLPSSWLVSWTHRCAFYCNGKEEEQVGGGGG